MRPILESLFFDKGYLFEKATKQAIKFCYTLLVLALLYALHAGFNFDLGGKRFVSKLHIEKGIRLPLNFLGIWPDAWEILIQLAPVGQQNQLESVLLWTNNSLLLILVTSEAFLVTLTRHCATSKLFLADSTHLCHKHASRQEPASSRSQQHRWRDWWVSGRNIHRSHAQIHANLEINFIAIFICGSSIFHSGFQSWCSYGYYSIPSNHTKGGTRCMSWTDSRSKVDLPPPPPKSPHFDGSQQMRVKHLFRSLLTCWRFAFCWFSQSRHIKT